MNRLLLAFRAFWRVVTDQDVATRVGQLFSKEPTGPDLRVLTVLQRDGRLVDFLKEDIDGLNDAMIGASVRAIHQSCRKALSEYMTIEPVVATPEGEPIIVEPDFDRAAIRLTGNVPNAPPFRGVLKHHGWRVTSVHLPVLPAARDQSSILAPAEVEIG